MAGRTRFTFVLSTKSLLFDHGLKAPLVDCSVPNNHTMHSNHDIYTMHSNQVITQITVDAEVNGEEKKPIKRRFLTKHRAAVEFPWQAGVLVTSPLQVCEVF